MLSSSIAALVALVPGAEPGAAPKAVAPAPAAEVAEKPEIEIDDDPQQAIDALEIAYSVSPRPEILLAIAAVFERWPGHCDDARDAYERFLHACDDCVARAHGVERFDRVGKTCIETALVPAPVPVAPEATAEGVTFEDALKHFGVAATLNWPKTLPGRDQALAALAAGEPQIKRIKEVLIAVGFVDASARARLTERVLAAEQSGDHSALAAIRQSAIAILRAGATREGQGGCFAVATGDPGYLTINTTPWSEIYVNGVRRGTTPASHIELPAGCVSVRAVNPVTNESVVRTVTIRPNAVAIYQLALADATARLRYRKRDVQ